MAMNRTANVGIELYAPNTVFDYVITMPVSYDFTGKEAVFSTKKGDDVTYSYSSEDGAGIIISGQTVTVALSPTMTGAEYFPMRFLDAIGELDAIDFRIDLKTVGSIVTDYRFQGVINVLESHGKPNL